MQVAEPTTLGTREQVKRLWPYAPAIIFALGFACRMVLMFIFGEYKGLHRFEMERVALAFAHYGTLANPYAVQTGPTAHVSPAYPVILGLLFRWFGVGVTAQIVKGAICSAIDSLVYALLPTFASGLGLSRTVGLLAGITGALLPLKLHTQTIGDWEAVPAALVLLIGLYLVASRWRTGVFTVRAGLLDGAWWGVVLLFVGAAVFPYLCLLGAGFALFRKAFAKYALTAALVTFSMLTPWAVRNYVQLGSPIVTRSNIGLELRISNNDSATAQEHVNSIHGLYQFYHPFQNKDEALKVRELGEVEYNQRAMKSALKWIRSHKSRFGMLTLERFRFYWFPISGWGARGIVFSLASLLAGIGCYRLYKHSRVAAVVILVWLVLFPLPDYLTQVSYRHRYSIDWLLILLGMLAVVDLAKLAKNRS